MVMKYITLPYTSHSCTSHSCTSHSCTSHSCTSHSCTSHSCTSHSCTSHSCTSHSCTSHSCTPHSCTSHSCTPHSHYLVESYTTAKDVLAAAHDRFAAKLQRALANSSATHTCDGETGAPPAALGTPVAPPPPPCQVDPTLVGISPLLLERVGEGVGRRGIIEEKSFEFFKFSSDFELG